jgi:hypothetical protein
MSLALEYQANDPHHYYMYTDEIFQTQFVSSQVSDFDCFHPSADGQRELAAATWEDGPFSVPEPSGALAPSLAVIGLAYGWRRRRRNRKGQGAVRSSCPATRSESM